MLVSVAEAKEQLGELMRRAEAGEQVLLSEMGGPLVRLVPLSREELREHRRQVLEEFRASAKGKMTPGPSAARSADFLFDEDGLPG